MTRTQLRKDLREFTEGAIVISIGQLSKAIRVRRADAAEICEGCAYDSRGKQKLYYISDVADKLIERRCI